MAIRRSSGVSSSATPNMGALGAIARALEVRRAETARKQELALQNKQMMMENEVAERRLDIMEQTAAEEAKTKRDIERLQQKSALDKENRDREWQREKYELDRELEVRKYEADQKYRAERLTDYDKDRSIREGTAKGVQQRADAKKQLESDQIWLHTQPAYIEIAEKASAARTGREIAIKQEKNDVATKYDNEYRSYYNQMKDLDNRASELRKDSTANLAKSTPKQISETVEPITTGGGMYSRVIGEATRPFESAPMTGATAEVAPVKIETDAVTGEPIETPEPVIDSEPVSEIKKTFPGYDPNKKYVMPGAEYEPVSEETIGRNIQQTMAKGATLDKTDSEYLEYRDKYNALWNKWQRKKDYEQFHTQRIPNSSIASDYRVEKNQVRKQIADIEKKWNTVKARKSPEYWQKLEQERPAPKTWGEAVKGGLMNMMVAEEKGFAGALDIVGRGIKKLDEMGVNATAEILDRVGIDADKPEVKDNFFMNAAKNRNKSLEEFSQVFSEEMDMSVSKQSDPFAWYIRNPQYAIATLIESAPMMIKMMAGGAYGKTLKPASKFIPWLTSTVVGSADLIPKGYQEARDEGASPREAFIYAVVAKPIEAGIEGWSLGQMIKGWDRIGKSLSQAASKSILTGLLWEGGKAYAREGIIEEGSQAVNDNFWKYVFYKPDQKIFENVKEQMAAGGAAGTIMSLFGGIINAPAQYQSNKAEQAEILDNTEKIIDKSNIKPEYKEEARAIINDKKVEIEQSPSELPTETPTEAVVTPDQPTEQPAVPTTIETETPATTEPIIKGPLYDADKKISDETQSGQTVYVSPRTPESKARAEEITSQLPNGAIITDPEGLLKLEVVVEYDQSGNRKVALKGENGNMIGGENALIFIERGAVISMPNIEVQRDNIQKRIESNQKRKSKAITEGRSTEHYDIIEQKWQEELNKLTDTPAVTPEAQVPTEEVAVKEPQELTEDEFIYRSYYESPSFYKGIAKRESQEAADFIKGLHSKNIETVDTHQIGDDFLVKIPSGVIEELGDGITPYLVPIESERAIKANKDNFRDILNLLPELESDIEQGGEATYEERQEAYKAWQEQAPAGEVTGEVAGEVAPKYDVYDESVSEFIENKKKELYKTGKATYESGDIKYLLTKSAKTKGGFQLTVFVKEKGEWIPSGDTQYKTLEDALEGLRSESGYLRKDIPPTYGLHKGEGRFEHLYHLKSRDVSLGTQPKEGFIRADDARTAVFNRVLSKKEIDDYELEPVGYNDLQATTPAEVAPTTETKPVPEQNLTKRAKAKKALAGEQISQPAETIAEKEKEPWEMTKEEFGLASYYTKYSSSLDTLRNPLINAYMKQNKLTDDYGWVTHATNDAYLGTPALKKKARAALESIGLKVQPLGGHFRGGKLINAREKIIEFALKEGKPVPPEVLAEYPDLQKKPIPDQNLTERGKKGEDATEITPNMPIGYVQAKKTPTGQWRLYFRGTRNEVFPNTLFDSVQDARRAFNVAKARLSQTTEVIPEINKPKKISLNLDEILSPQTAEQVAEPAPDATTEGEGEVKPTEGAFGATYTGKTPQYNDADTNRVDNNEPNPQVFTGLSLVKFARELLKGVYPVVMRRLRGNVSGRISYKRGEILLNADIWKGRIITAEAVNKDKVDERKEEMIAETLTKHPELTKDDIIVKIEPHRKKWGKKVVSLFHKDPNYANTVIAHEIGHAYSWMDEETIKKGGIFANIAALHKHLAQMLAIDPMKRISKKQRRSISRRASRLAKAQMGDYKTLRQEMLNDLARREGIVSKDAVMRELKALTQWWNPFNESADSDYTKYRHKAGELYAEAISVLLNNPHALRQRAPLFYELFHNYLGARPEAGAIYQQINKEIYANQTLENADKELSEDFAKSSELHAPRDRRVRTLADEIYSVFSSIYELSRKPLPDGGKLADEKNPKYAIGNAIYTPSERELFLNEVHDRVGSILRKNNIDQITFSKYLFHKQVISQPTIAHPKGWTTTTSTQALKELKDKMGDRYAAMEKAADIFFNEIWKPLIVDKIVESGMESEELNEYMAQNKDYVHVNVIEKAEQKLGRDNATKIYRKFGTVKPMADPLAETLHYGMRLLGAVNWNIAVEQTVELVKVHGDAIDAEPDGRGWFKESKDDKYGLVVYKKNGQYIGTYIPIRMAEGLNYRAPETTSLAAYILRVPTLIMKGLYTAYNLGFGSFNMFRDITRTMENAPKISTRQALKYTLRAMPKAIKRILGHPDPYVQEMLINNELISMANYQGMTSEGTEADRLMEMYKVIPPHRNLLYQIGHALLEINSMIESTGKIAGDMYLKENFPEMSSLERAYRVRKHVSSPDFLEKGYATQQMAQVVLFFNPFVQATVADIEVLKERPGERTWKHLKYNTIPSVLKFTLKNGLLSAFWAYALGIRPHKDDEEDTPDKLVSEKMYHWLQNQEKMYENISDYYLLNYQCAALGMTTKGKTVFLTLPQNETDRVVSGIFYKMLDYSYRKATGKPASVTSGMEGIARYGQEQLPGLNPVIGIPLAGILSLAGWNPTDRGVPIISEEAFEAGGVPKWKEYAKWVWNETGGSIVYRFRGGTPKDVGVELEKLWGIELAEPRSIASIISASQAPVVGNILGRFIRISDKGREEDYLKAAKEEKRLRSRALYILEGIIKKELAGESLTEDEQDFISKDPDYYKNRKKELRVFREGSAEERALEKAGSTKQKEAMIKIMEEKGYNYPERRGTIRFPSDDDPFPDPFKEDNNEFPDPFK